MKKPTFGHLDFLWGRVGSFYQNLNEHLEDLTPRDVEEVKRQMDFVHDNNEEMNAGSNAVFWYINSMSALMRIKMCKLIDLAAKKIPSNQLF